MALRSEINNKFKWHLNDLFETDDIWQKSYDDINNNVSQITGFKNKLNDLDILKQCLEKYHDISQKFGLLYVYAHMKLHEDTSNNFYQAMADKADMLSSKLSSASSFIEPEILNLDKNKLKDFVSKNKLYEHMIDNLLRLKNHILSPEIEKILADIEQISNAPENIYSMLNNADINFGKIKIKISSESDNNNNNNEQEIELTHGNYISFMESPDRELRKKVFNKYYDAYVNQKNTITAIYSSSVKKDVFYSRIRNFDSCVSQALFSKNISESVYYNLINTVNKYLPVLHDYMGIRKTKLGLKELYMYDIYVPLVSEFDKKIDFEEAKQTVKKALEPMGQDYINKLEEAFNNGWIDVYENKGKRSGAYSWGAYGCHPYVLLNFDNKLDDIFTLAHEMGHAMHSFYSWSTQPYIYSGHTIFLAEIASTVNETLLIKYLLKTTQDHNFRAYLINYFLEQFRRTLYRQTMFAEFELKTHELAEKDVPLTVDLLNKIYHDLNLKYHGQDVILDNKSDIEWSRIPHFYSAFYVYQYATGYSAAIALSEKILSEGSESYKEFLKAGISDYSLDILKKAGVDMTSPKPIESALDYFKNLVSEFKKIVL